MVSTAAPPAAGYGPKEGKGDRERGRQGRPPWRRSQTGGGDAQMQMEWRKKKVKGKERVEAEHWAHTCDGGEKNRPLASKVTVGV